METYNAIISSFWREDSKKHFSPCERSFFFYLLSVWGDNEHEHPFPCSSSIAERDLGMPRKTIIECRKKLHKRGLIDFEEGERKAKNPYYYFTEVTKRVTKNVTLTDSVTKVSPTPPSKDNIYINKQQHQQCVCACEKNLEELKEALMKADIWLDSVRLDLLRNYKIVFTDDEIKEKISDYFVHLQSEGINEKDETDAKKHFKNWIAKVHEIETKKQKDETRTKTNLRASSKPSFNNYDEAEARHVGGIESFEF